MSQASPCGAKECQLTCPGVYRHLYRRVSALANRGYGESCFVCCFPAPAWGCKELSSQGSSTPCIWAVRGSGRSRWSRNPDAHGRSLRPKCKGHAPCNPADRRTEGRIGWPIESPFRPDTPRRDPMDIGVSASWPPPVCFVGCELCVVRMSHTTWSRFGAGAFRDATLWNRPGCGTCLRDPNCGSVGSFYFLFPTSLMEKKNSTARKADANRPVKTMSLQGVRCSIFANQAERDGDTITYHKVSLARTYRDGEEFKTTTSLGREDLPTAAFLLEQACAYILEAESRERDANGE